MTHNIPGRRTTIALSHDGRLLFVARGVRLFGYGLISIVLVLYLAQVGLTTPQIGLLLAVPSLLSVPFFLAGGVKVIYDVLLWMNFRAAAAPGEQDLSRAFAGSPAPARSKSRMCRRLVQASGKDVSP